MRLRGLATLVMLGLPGFAMAQHDPAPGVTAELAAERAATIANLRYDVTFRVPADQSQPVTGRTVVRFDWSAGAGPLILDFAASPDQVKTVEARGEAAAARLVNGHLVVDRGALVGGRAGGEVELTVEFTAGNAPLNRGADFLYTLFVPARAHEALPCFDQPSLKARVSLALDLPSQWTAVANGAEMQRETAADRTTIRFAETRPLPPYLVAFAAGRLSIETAERHGRTFRMFHRETDRARLDRNREVIFDLHASALAWLEQYTGIPYPWGKFDFFLAPAFQFGGMEHAGAIFYNAPALLLEESATKNQLLGRASLIAHETAHMWFGDLVTMRWFDDVWMKEVFANFMAAKVVNPSFPEINHDLRFLFSHYPAAYDVDRTAGTHPIRQALDNLKNAGSLYGPIIYQKAPVVMRQLERLMGEEGMRDGLREYLTKYAFANASWPDLIALLDARTPEDLAVWSRAWVEQAARPTIRTELVVDDGVISRLSLAQSDPLGRRLAWPQQFEVSLGYAEGVRTLQARLDGSRVDLEAARGLPAPVFVLANGQGLGYGLIVPDEPSLAWLVANVDRVPDALTRGSAWVTLWDQMLEGRVAPREVLLLCLRSLGAERDELNVQRILTYAERAYWRFLDRDTRTASAVHLERVLREGLDAAPTSTLKGAWFRALVGVAATPELLAWLEQVWRQDVRVPGLALAEPDFTSLAYELAVRDVPAADVILDGQLARIENADRRARFEFVRPALSRDQATRDRFFASLADAASRRREPWVVEALTYLHHPLRSGQSAKYIRPSLDMLEEIQQTGDIFFPKRWTDATLGGHGDADAAATVTAYLEARPDLPDRLRRIVLQSADELFRASRLRSFASR